MVGSMGGCEGWHDSPNGLSSKFRREAGLPSEPTPACEATPLHITHIYVRPSTFCSLSKVSPGQIFMSACLFHLAHCVTFSTSWIETGPSHPATATSRTLTHEQLLPDSTSIMKSFHDEARKQLHSCHVSFPNADQTGSSICR